MELFKKKSHTPLTDEYKLRFIPLGGVVGVTKNMYVYEIYKNGALQDILIVDSVLAFLRKRSWEWIL
jgi:mRNA degradation ribonuclease J1/J2